MAVAVIMLAAVAAPALASEATVGRFVQELAKVKNLNATDPAIAADSLRAVGVRLPSGLQYTKRLTEADVADISRSAGLLVTTSNPDAYFGEEKVDRFFQAFAVELTQNAGSGEIITTTDTASQPFDPFTKGKSNGNGKGKGGRTPTDPE
jgi:hypothetical protein